MERKGKDAAGAVPKELSWRDWALRRYARSWYWLGVIFLDIAILLESLRQGVDVVVAGGVAAGALLIEITLFLRIWGRNAPLGPKDDDE